jgi:hypothetical protein
MLEQWPPSAPVIEALQESLRGRDNVSARRAAEARIFEQKLSHAEQFERLHTLITEAFSYPELERLLRFRLDVRLEPITTLGPIDRTVFELLKWAESRGRLRELVLALAEARPDRPEFQELLRSIEA